MKSFETVKAKLEEKGVPFEEITFTDEAVSARISDTSFEHNYNPENAIKTIVISTKEGFKAVILKGSDRIDQPKLKSIVGKWNIVDGQTLENDIGFIPGTICPLDLDMQILVDEDVLLLNVWSMGAGTINKGLNVTTENAVKYLGKYQKVSVKQK